MEPTHVEVDTKLGRLRGCTRQSDFTGNTYYAFLGIPFAKPPIGHLRFKAPEPFGGWDGVRDALEDGNDPVQPVLIPQPGKDVNKPTGDEDCLYLNVFMTEMPEENRPKMPVMVSVHGGGFYGGSGSSKMAGPDYMLNGDVVLVYFSYRSGAFGFLSLETEDVPGNAGLKDSVLALKWVRDNIDSFGGDPNNVTIYGISAGGAAVNHLLLSPLSKGLFHKAIVQSGFATNGWALQRSPKPKLMATILAKELGCLSDNIDDIYRTLMEASAEEIYQATKDLLENKEISKSNDFTFSMFAPCVEVAGSDPFLAEDPEVLSERGELHNVPVIIGLCQNEGVAAGFYILGKSGDELDKLNECPERIVPLRMGLKPGSAEEKEAAREICDFYFKGAPLSWDNVHDYVTFQGDETFNLGFEVARAGLLRSPAPEVYTYLFTNHSECVCVQFKVILGGNMSKVISEETCHGADVLWLYVNHMFEKGEMTPQMREGIKRHVKVWTSFAATGDPNCPEMGASWPKDSLENPCFMDIGPSWTLREGVPFADRFAFWKQLTTKYCNS